MSVQVTARPREVAEGIVQCFKNGDFPGIANWLAEDVDWWIFGADYVGDNEGRYHGRQSVRDDFLSTFLPSVFKLDPPPMVELRALFEDGPHAIVEWTVTGTAVSGYKYHNNYCLVFVVEEGLVAKARVYFDTQYARKVMHDGLDVPAVDVSSIM